MARMQVPTDQIMSERMKRYVVAIPSLKSNSASCFGPEVYDIVAIVQGCLAVQTWSIDVKAGRSS